MFAVFIGLEQAGRPVLGVIEMPALRRRVWGARGVGAFEDGAPLRVSTTALLDEALLATGFPYDRRTAADDNTREHVAFMKRSQGVRRCGAAAIDMALVARGTYDGFWEPRLKPWDLSAGTIIIEEAGGLVTGYDGEPLDTRRAWVVAGNPAIHPQMLSLLSKVRGAL
jgi:myo-inositol-1(or 4)-monophosphatase